MSWQVLLSISVLASCAYTIVQRILLKKEHVDPIALSVIFQLFGGIFVGLYALFHGFKMPDLLSVLPNVILMIFLYGASSILFFKGLKYLEASEYTILAATRVLWTILSAVLFLHEVFLAKQILGTVLILTSVVLVSWKVSKFKLNEGVTLVLLGAMTFGLALTNDSFIVRNADVASYMSIAFILPSLVTWIAFPRSTKHMRALFKPDSFYLMAMTSAMAGVSAIAYFSAYQVGRNAAQISSLNQISSILTVVLAIILLRERNEIEKKIAAVLISFVGVLLVL